MTENTVPTTNTVDPRLRRLLRDLTAIGLMEAADGPTAAERLNTTLGSELHRAVHAGNHHPLPLRSRSGRVA